MKMYCVLLWHMTFYKSFIFLVVRFLLHISAVSGVAQNKGKWKVLTCIIRRKMDLISMKSCFCIVKRVKICQSHDFEILRQVQSCFFKIFSSFIAWPKTIRGDGHLCIAFNVLWVRILGPETPAHLYQHCAVLN